MNSVTQTSSDNERGNEVTESGQFSHSNHVNSNIPISHKRATSSASSQTNDFSLSGSDSMDKQAPIMRRSSNRGGPRPYCKHSDSKIVQIMDLDDSTMKSVSASLAIGGYQFAGNSVTAPSHINIDHKLSCYGNRGHNALTDGWGREKFNLRTGSFMGKLHYKGMKNSCSQELNNDNQSPLFANCCSDNSDQLLSTSLNATVLPTANSSLALQSTYDPSCTLKEDNLIKLNRKLLKKCSSAGLPIRSQTLDVRKSADISGLDNIVSDLLNQIENIDQLRGHSDLIEADSKSSELKRFKHHSYHSTCKETDCKDHCDVSHDSIKPSSTKPSRIAFLSKTLPPNQSFDNSDLLRLNKEIEELQRCESSTSGPKSDKNKSYNSRRRNQEKSNSGDNHIVLVGAKRDSQANIVPSITSSTVISNISSPTANLNITSPSAVMTKRYSVSTNTNDIENGCAKQLIQTEDLAANFRWSDFPIISKSTCQCATNRQDILHMSAIQINMLKKLALLRLTALTEKYCPPSRSIFNWTIPKLLRRSGNNSDVSNESKTFGISLSTYLYYHNCIPPNVIHKAMLYLEEHGKDSLGIFRKPGCQARITELREILEADSDMDYFSTFQPYDVADVLKQYFRCLPECLLTNKLSATLINIFTCVPTALRLEALLWAMLRLPDENRIALQALITFLKKLSLESENTKMNASNLSVCFTPSLFYFSHALTNVGASPKHPRKSPYSPDQREMLEQKAAQECLTTIIENADIMFTVENETIAQCHFSADEIGLPPDLHALLPAVELLQAAGYNKSYNTSMGWKIWLDARVANLIKECSTDKTNKGWQSIVHRYDNDVEVSFKKSSTDGQGILKLWKCFVEVDAEPMEVLNTIWSQRHAWEPRLKSEEIVEELSKDCQVVYTEYEGPFISQPIRKSCVLRARHKSAKQCALVSTSISHERYKALVALDQHDSIWEVVAVDEYLIELVTPQEMFKIKRSKVHWISKIDLRGNTIEWYNKFWCNIAAAKLLSLKMLFADLKK